MWSLPSICPAVLEKKIFICFGVNAIWLANHLTHDITCEPFVPHGQEVIRVKFCLDLFSHFREDFWTFKKKKNNMAAESQDRWRHELFFSVDHFIPRWPSKIFILIRCSILRMQLWCHNKGTYDVIKKNHTYSPWVLAVCQVSIFSLVQFQRYRGPKFFHFSNMAATPRELWRHNYD